MEIADRVYFLKSLGSRISPGAVAEAQSSMDYSGMAMPRTDAYEKAEITAMSAVGARRIELALEFGTELLFDVELDAMSLDIMLNVLYPGLMSRIRKITDPVVTRMLPPEATVASQPFIRLACVRYLNSVLRYDVAHSRDRTDVAERALRERLLPELRYEYPDVEWDAVLSGPRDSEPYVYIREAMYHVLYLTADVPDMDRISDQSWRDAVRRTFQTLPYRPTGVRS